MDIEIEKIQRELQESLEELDKEMKYYYISDNKDGVCFDVHNIYWRIGAGDSSPSLDVHFISNKNIMRNYNLYIHYKIELENLCAKVLSDIFCEEYDIFVTINSGFV